MVAWHGRDESRLDRYPVLKDIYSAFSEAGKELALSGRISRPTRKRANRRLIDIPFFVKPMSRFKAFQRIIEEKINRSF